MTEESAETPNSSAVYREPPPSLGLVAQIWAGHLGPGAPDPADETPAAAPPVIDLTLVAEERMPVD